MNVVVIRDITPVGITLFGMEPLRYLSQRNHYQKT